MLYTIIMRFINLDSKRTYFNSNMFLKMFLTVQPNLQFIEKQKKIYVSPCECLLALKHKKPLSLYREKQIYSFNQ